MAAALTASSLRPLDSTCPWDLSSMRPAATQDMARSTASCPASALKAKPPPTSSTAAALEVMVADRMLRSARAASLRNREDRESSQVGRVEDTTRKPWGLKAAPRGGPSWSKVLETPLAMNLLPAACGEHIAARCSRATSRTSWVAMEAVAVVVMVGARVCVCVCVSVTVTVTGESARKSVRAPTHYKVHWKFGEARHIGSEELFNDG